MNQLLQHFKTLTTHPKNAQELKGLVLQLAVQGKLTKQWRLDNPKVESADVLLKKIKEEKAQLIQEKKIKKEKPLDEITTDEIPYKLPKRWTWCRLNDVCEYIQRGKSPKYTEEPKIPVISQKCVQWSGFDITRARFITEESLEKYGIERYLQKGDLLWNSTGDGTIGRVISFPGSEFKRVVADSHVTVVRGFKRYISSDYLWIFTASPLTQNLVAGRISGSTKQTELGTGTVKHMEFSFPPLEEQKAIVLVVNQLFVEIEKLEQQTKARIQLKQDYVTSALQQLANGDTAKEWASIQAKFSSFFTEKTAVKKLRESILQLAVQGKLTRAFRESHPELCEGSNSAIALLEKIKAEKAQLIKEGKIRKEKPLPPITKDEMPYQLQENWVWCRMRDVSFSIVPNRDKPKSFTGDITWLTTRNLEKQSNKIHSKDSDNKLSKKELIDYNARLLPAYSVIMSCVGQFGLSAILDKEYSCNQQLHCFVPLGDANPFYMDFLIKNGKKTYENMASATTIAYLNKTKCESLAISFPPKEEQKAIVEKVNTLMALCDSLEKEIEQNTTQVEQLMQSCLREVLEG